MSHQSIEIQDDEEEEYQYDEDFDFVVPPPKPQNEDFNDANFDDIAAYHTFVQVTFLDSRRKHKASDDEIHSACYPNKRMLLISRLESYLAYKIETSSKTMRTMMRAADREEEANTLSITEGTTRFQSFWETIQDCWDHVEGFRDAMEEQVAYEYEDQATKVYESRIWDDVTRFGCDMMEALEKELAKYERATLREVALRHKAARTEENLRNKDKRAKSSKLNYEEIMIDDEEELEESENEDGDDQ